MRCGGAAVFLQRVEHELWGMLSDIEWCQWLRPLAYQECMTRVRLSAEGVMMPHGAGQGESGKMFLWNEWLNARVEAAACAGRMST
jgi:hypothetical protein